MNVIALNLIPDDPSLCGLFGQRIVIFGGGDVAARKAAYFSREAEVLVVSRSFSPKIETLPVQRRVL